MQMLLLATTVVADYHSITRSGFKTPSRAQFSIFAIATTGQAVLD